MIAADDARLSEGNIRIEAKDGVLQIESMKRETVFRRIMELSSFEGQKMAL